MYSIFFSTILIAQNTNQEVALSYKGNSTYRLIERTDLRKYNNGKYSGLLSRIVNSAITCEGGNSNQPGTIIFSGNFWVEQATKKSFATVASFSQSIESKFSIDKDGILKMIEDNGYPTFRSFPSYPKENVKVGQSWQSVMFRAVDPRDDSHITRLRCDVKYTLLGEELYKEQKVYTMLAEWATRYGLSYRDYDGDPSLTKAAGSHKATMYISKSTGAALVVRDSVDEIFSYDNGDTVAFKGTISLFTEYPPARDTKPIVAALVAVTPPVKNTIEPTQKPSENFIQRENNLNKASTQNIDNRNKIADAIATSNNGSATVTTKETDSGLLLTLQNLHFKSDEAVLLDSDKSFVKNVAAALKKAGSDQKFLIEGHTANTGNPRGEKSLSLERAKTIAELLEKEGIDRTRMILRGSGATKPVADNSTPSGKAMNRRVEITVLN